MKLLIVSIFLATSIFASKSSIDFYNKSKDNQLLCKVSENSYKVISMNNSIIVVINGSKLFKIKNENTYINSSGCHIVKDGSTAIIF